MSTIPKALTAEDIYAMLKDQLAHSCAYISKDDPLNSVTVDGIVDCESMAKFLNERLKAGLPAKSERKTA